MGALSSKTIWAKLKRPKAGRIPLLREKLSPVNLQLQTTA